MNKCKYNHARDRKHWRAVLIYHGEATIKVWHRRLAASASRSAVGSLARAVRSSDKRHFQALPMERTGVCALSTFGPLEKRATKTLFCLLSSSRARGCTTSGQSRKLTAERSGMKSGSGSRKMSLNPRRDLISIPALSLGTFLVCPKDDQTRDKPQTAIFFQLFEPGPPGSGDKCVQDEQHATVGSYGHYRVFNRTG